MHFFYGRNFGIFRKSRGIKNFGILVIKGDKLSIINFWKFWEILIDILAVRKF